MKNIFVTAIIASILCANTAWAKATTTTRTCPAGMFCTNNGTYTATNGDIPAYMLGPSELVAPGWGMWMDEGLCDTRQSNGSCVYIATDYDEVWVSTWFGFYMVKNGTVSYKAAKDASFQGVFACPGTYPSSESGASSVSQCYRTTSNGQKEYYKAPSNTQPSRDGSYNTDEINAMLINLQSALDQAKTAAQNLQRVLKQSNNQINVMKNSVTKTQMRTDEFKREITNQISVKPKSGLLEKSRTADPRVGVTKKSLLNNANSQSDSVSE